MTDDIDTDDPDMQGDWRTPADRARDIAQAKALREQASKGGLRFEVFLPPGLAEWVLDFVERRVFLIRAKPSSSFLGSIRIWSRTANSARRAERHEQDHDFRREFGLTAPLSKSPTAAARDRFPRRPCVP